MSTRHEYIHPALRPIVDAIAPRLLEPTDGPLTPEPAVNHVMTFDGLVELLADVDDRPENLRALTLPEWALVLAHYPEALWEPLVDGQAQLLEPLNDGESTVCIEARVGRAFLTLARSFALPMLLSVVQARWELHHEAARYENPFPVAS